MDKASGSVFLGTVCEGAVALGQIVHDLGEKRGRLCGGFDLDGIEPVVDEPGCVSALRRVVAPVVEIGSQGNPWFLPRTQTIGLVGRRSALLPFQSPSSQSGTWRPVVIVTQEELSIDRL